MNAVDVLELAYGVLIIFALIVIGVAWYTRHRKTGREEV